MIRALDLRLRPSLLTLGLCLAVGCGGESKPAAKSPTPQAQSDAAKPDQAAPTDAKGAEPTAAAGAGDKVKVVEGKSPSGDDRYALQIEPPAEAAAGKEGEVVVRVVPKEPWHMNLDFPTSLEVSPPAGITLVSAKLGKGDARKLDEGSCEFAVKFTPAEAGEHTMTGKFKFAVCQDEACSPVTEEVQMRVAVK
ncbi:MAG: hypothetical protein KDK70_22830 [Myxococcales bacterium]|nr:hypothetical protein [Myxococcales bacterium]